MEQEAVQELPILSFTAKYRSNTGYSFNSTIKAKTYDEAFQYAQLVVEVVRA